MQETKEREIARLEQFQLSKRDSDYIRSCSYGVTIRRDREIVRALTKDGATVQDIIDIYENNNIGKYSNGFKTNGGKHIENLVSDVSVPLTDVIEDTLQEHGFVFRRNLMTDEIHIRIPGYEKEQKYDNFVLAEVNKIAINTKIGSRNDFEDVVRSLANKNAFHPIREYFTGLVWDGQDTIKKLSSYLTDEHDPIVYPDGTQRTVIHVYLLRFFVGLIRRVFDNNTENAMLVLHGRQGDGKSFFAKWLCPKPEWFIEGDLDVNDKDKIRSLREKLIWEVAELGATIKKSDREALKSVITMREVTARNPYDRMPTSKPVMTSFIGTINPGDDGFLNDSSGHRRFNVVEIGAINQAYSQEIDINQAWAQAYHLYLQGEAGALLPCEADAQKRINSVHEVADLVEEALFEIMEIIDPEMHTEPLKATEIVHVLQTYLNFRDSNESLNRKITNALVKNGFSKSKHIKLIHKTNYWRGVKLKAKYDRNAREVGEDGSF